MNDDDPRWRDAALAKLRAELNTMKRWIVFLTAWVAYLTWIIGRKFGAW